MAVRHGYQGAILAPTVVADDFWALPSYAEYEYLERWAELLELRQSAERDEFWGFD